MTANWKLNNEQLDSVYHLTLNHTHTHKHKKNEQTSCYNNSRLAGITATSDSG